MQELKNSLTEKQLKNANLVILHKKNSDTAFNFNSGKVFNNFCFTKVFNRKITTDGHNYKFKCLFSLNKL